MVLLGFGAGALFSPNAGRGIRLATNCYPGTLVGMTDAADSPRRIAPTVRAVVTSRMTLWAAFIAVHVWLGMLNLYGPGFPIGDVTLVYKQWTDQIVLYDYWVGVDTVWVYPVVAIVPMLAAFAFGPALYASTWLTIVMLLDAVAFAAITGWMASRDRASVAWWWIAFLLLLGPIALARIDSITVPLAIVGVILLATRPTAAAVVLTVATWIKVWPAAIVLAVLIATRRRREVVIAGALVSAVIVGVALLFGSGANVFSFITQQTGRGLQVEAPVTTLWLWLARAGVPGTRVYYDQDILTYQMLGGGVTATAAAMTPVLAVAVAGVAALGVWAARRGAPATQLLAPLALAIVTTLIAFNKVGSPQFISWLAVVVVLGLGTHHAGYGRSFAVPSAIVLVVAALTQAFYPYLYIDLLTLNPILLVVITARNLLLFVLLAWAIREVVHVARHPEPAESLPAAAILAKD
jgi:hypothetical protein